MPHILMRFFTVKDAKEARKSVLYASGFIGYFFNVLLILGLASIVIVSQDLRFFGLATSMASCWAAETWWRCTLHMPWAVT